MPDLKQIDARIWILGSFVLMACLMVMQAYIDDRNEKQNQALIVQAYKQGTELQLNAKDLSVSFGYQVAAIKDLLLRGKDADLYHAQLSQYYTAERETLEQLDKTFSLLSDDDQIKLLRQKITDEYRLLGKRYRDAIRVFNASEEQAHVFADRVLKDSDKSFISLLATLSEKVVRLQQEKVKQLQRETEIRHYYNWLIIALISTPFIILLYIILDKKVKALRDSEARYQRVEQGTNDGLWDWDIATDTNYFSPRFIELLGYSSDDEFPQTMEYFSSKLHPDELDRVSKAVRKHLEEHEPYSIEYQLQMKDGSYRWFFARGQAIWNKEGKPVRMSGSASDITERKQNEAELNKYREHLEELVNERTKELQNTQDELVRKERLATLGQLTATVSHELRNPLGAMRPSLYIINKKSDKGDERVQKAIERVDRNIDRCDHIIDELLDFTRITELDRHATRFDEWLESVIDEQVIPEGIQVEKDFPLKDVVVDIDTNRLCRAIINVVENACHAMLDDNQQVIDKENSRLQIKTESNKERIEIAITDTGSGIPEDILEKVFEPLFSTKSFGVGLGMPTVKQIMEQHGGDIEINSEQAKGTTVSLWLPRSITSNNGDEVAA